MGGNVKNIFYCVLVIAGLGMNNVWAQDSDCLQDPTGYAARLDKCEMFSCIFTHPFSKEELNKHILGLESGKCKTQEEMPNKGLMTCNFSEKQRKEVAAYLRKTAKAKTIESKTNINIASGKSKQVEKQDGKMVENPLNKAMQDGTCVVSGYGK